MPHQVAQPVPCQIRDGPVWQVLYLYDLSTCILDGEVSSCALMWQVVYALAPWTTLSSLLSSLLWEREALAMGARVQRISLVLISTLAFIKSILFIKEIAPIMMSCIHTSGGGAFTLIW